MSKIAITDYFDFPSKEEKNILGDLISTQPTIDTEILLVWHEIINSDYIKKFPNLRGIQRYGVDGRRREVRFHCKCSIHCYPRRFR